MGIIEIPAKLNKNTGKKINAKVKKRVCGYIRVSTNLDEQKNSYKSQYEYYLKYISGNPDWKFVKLYADKGITGTSTINRQGFNEMIEDAKEGKIDMIVTKSISRFARNTVDSLKTIRELKGVGVDVFFERENFHTIADGSELLLSIISGISQEESHSISENTKWGIQKKYKGGIARRPYTKILGFTKDEKGNLIVNNHETDIVKFVFNKYMEGLSTSAIAQQLIEYGYRDTKGKCDWNASAIIKILKNEIYKGDSIMQKYFSKDFINKTSVLNTGELARYEVIDDHKGIIDRDLFDCVQFEIKQRENERQASRKSILSSKLFCGMCKAPLGRKTWIKHGEKVLVYLCTDRKQEMCKLQYFREDDAKNECIKAINYLLINKNRIIKRHIENNTYDNIDSLSSKKSLLEESLYELRLKIDDILPDIKDNKENVDYINKRRKECDELYKIHDVKNNELISVNDEIAAAKCKKLKNSIFLECLNNFNGSIKKYDEDLCAKLIDKMYVYNDKINIVYKNDMKVIFNR